jgi:DGQHR domain-containing protein
MALHKKKQRRRRKNKGVIRRRALKIEQNNRHPLYTFCLTGDEILSIADISRLSRGDTGKLIGYQRPQVKRHVQDIVQYLNSQDVLFPNSLILALSSTIKFRTSTGPRDRDGLVVAGTLEIPLPRNGHRPAWIVDGQQRALAISKSNRRDLPVPINAFVADEVELQRDQFLRVNNTKPLPRGLITELLPEVSTPLPANLQAKKIPSAICDLLNTEPRSPFRGLISRASSTKAQRKRAVVTDTSIVKMIQESISNPSGCLFAYRNIATGEADFDGMWATLVTFWEAVKRAFPEAWGKPASRSRLMHGAGILAMGKLMDRVMASVDIQRHGAVSQVQHELRSVAPVCHWTGGRWSGLGDLEWSELQNVPRHIRMLSNLLVRAYVHGTGANQ